MGFGVYLGDGWWKSRARRKRDDLMNHIECLNSIIASYEKTIEELAEYGWMPIATKPTSLHCEERGEYRTDDGSLWYFKPTHWRPIPQHADQ